MADRLHLTIGEVLSLLKQEFPDVSISKIRFLESQGLVNPERTPSGYRKFYDQDVDRLRWILRQQREHFLPLKVIRGRLSGEEGSGGEATTDGPDAGEVGSVAARHRAAGHEGAGGRIGPSEEQGAPDGAAEAGTGTADRGASVTKDGGSPVAVPVAARGGGRASPEAAELRPSGASTLRAAGEARSAAASRTPVRAGADRDSGPAPAGGQGSAGPAEAASDGPEVGADAGAAAGRGTGPVGSAPPGSGAPAGTARGGGPGGAAPAGAVRPEGAAPSSSESGGDGPGGPGSRPTPSGGATGGARDERTAASGRSGAASGRRAPGAPGGHPDVYTGTELAAHVGCPVQLISDLEQYGILSAGTSVGGVAYFDPEAVALARIGARFAELGVEPRHLRTWRNAADREAGLFEQLVMPLLRQRNPQARHQVAERLEELTRLGGELRDGLITEAVRQIR